MQPTESAVLVLIPEAESAVARHRADLERSVLWLAPEPAETFRALTAAVASAFPGYVPYAGAHSDVVPHLTIGQDQPGRVLESAARAIELSLPFTARVSTAVLMHGSLEAGSWRVVADIRLGHPTASTAC